MSRARRVRNKYRSRNRGNRPAWGGRRRACSAKSSGSELICECASAGTSTCDQFASCQGKVNSGKMTLKEYYEICTQKKNYVIVSEEEKNRIENVCKRSGNDNWVWSEEDGYYYPEFI
tara:strand:- start:24 stop:377 length:354 start_codon:yes stop_codon:yes gene_type:complete